MKLSALIYIAGFIAIAAAKNVVDLESLKVAVAAELSGEKREAKNVVDFKEFTGAKRDEEPVIKRDDYIIKRGEEPVIKRDDYIIKRDEEPVIKRDEQPVIKRDDYIIKRDEEPVIKRDEQPVIKREAKNVVDIKKFTGAKRDEEPVIKRDDYVIKRDEEPVIKRDEQPVIKRDEQPVIKRDEQPVIKRDDYVIKRDEQPVIKRSPKNVFKFSDFKVDTRKRSDVTTFDMSRIYQEFSGLPAEGTVHFDIPSKDIHQNLLESILPTIPSISIISRYLRDNGELAQRTAAENNFMVLLAPTDKAISALFKKPWEFPREVNDDADAEANINDFLSHHIISDFTGELDIDHTLNLIKNKLDDGALLKIKQENEAFSVEVNNNNYWIPVEGVKQVDNGLVLVISEVIIHSDDMNVAK